MVIFYSDVVEIEKSFVIMASTNFYTEKFEWLVNQKDKSESDTILSSIMSAENDSYSELDHSVYDKGKCTNHAGI